MGGSSSFLPVLFANNRTALITVVVLRLQSLLSWVRVNGYL
jgi:hypothetical protein